MLPTAGPSRSTTGKAIPKSARRISSWAPRATKTMCSPAPTSNPAVQETAGGRPHGPPGGTRRHAWCGGARPGHTAPMPETRARACSAAMGAGKRLDDRVEFVRSQAPYRFAARPDLQNIRRPLGKRLPALRRTNHPGGQVGGLNLLIHEPGIIFEAAVIRGLIGEDEERNASLAPFALHELA